MKPDVSKIFYFFHESALADLEKRGVALPHSANSFFSRARVKNYFMADC